MLPIAPEAKTEVPDYLIKYKRRHSIMRLYKLVFAIVAAITSSAFVVTPASAAHDPCKVLTAETFSKAMGYTATINKTASTQMSCFYNGPGNSGGQFMILTEAAAGPQVDAMLKGPGSAPPPGSGLVGGTYKEGTIVFSVSIESTDQAKLQALVDEIRRNLK
jgi:hypothetical protein